MHQTAVTDTGVLRLFTNVKNLEKITIGLSNTTVTDNFVEKLLNKFLPEMKSLKKFILHIENTNISKEAYHNIKAVLAKIMEEKKSIEI